MLMRTAAIALILLLNVCSAYSQDFAGYWKGDISVSGQKLTICFEISECGDTTYTAALDVPQQLAYGIEAGVVVDGLKIKIDISSIAASFDGVYLYKVINGTFHQSGLDFQLVLAPSERPSEEAMRPQTPLKPYPYEVEEVGFRNPREGNLLSGTLTLPENRNSLTAVVLVSGSGSQDRDETILGHKPFLVIADYLTRQGIAVLRYDDRGVGGSGKTENIPTTENLSYDAQGAVEYLRGRSDIGKIGIIGHSEGGSIALMLADRNQADFIVTLAGAFAKGSEVLLSQQEAILRAQGLPDGAIDGIVKANRSIFEAVEKSDSPDSSLENACRTILKSYGITDDGQIEKTLSDILNPWMYYFLRFDPKEIIEDIDIPMLAVNGTKDLQVISSLNLGVLRKLAGDKKCVTIMEPEGLNHLLQECVTGHPSEYGTISQTISPDILDAVGSWIRLL